MNVGAVGEITVGIDTSFFLASTSIGVNVGATNEIEITGAVGAQIGLEATYRMKRTKVLLGRMQTKLLDLLNAGDKKAIHAVKKTPKMFTCFL